MAKSDQERSIHSFADARGFEAWIADRAIDDPGVWLKFARKASGIPSISKQEAIDIALCHGWIDGQIRRRDEATYRQRFTPRRRRSAWSKRNATIAERLLAEGRMHAAGIEEVERAKADGRWQGAYAGSAGIEVPADLVRALAADPKARAMFERLSRQNRYAILYRIATAKRADTRARRIRQFLAMLRRGETIHTQRRRADSRPEDSP